MATRNPYDEDPAWFVGCVVVTVVSVLLVGLLRIMAG